MDDLPRLLDPARPVVSVLFVHEAETAVAEVLRYRLLDPALVDLERVIRETGSRADRFAQSDLARACDLAERLARQATPAFELRILGDAPALVSNPLGAKRDLHPVPLPLVSAWQRERRRACLADWWWRAGLDPSWTKQRHARVWCVSPASLHSWVRAESTFSNPTGLTSDEAA